MTGYNVASDNYNRAFQNASYTDNLKMNQLSNTFNMSNALANQDYSRMLDAVKIGSGAASSAGAAASAYGGNAASIYQNTGSALAGLQMQQGSNMAGFYSGLGALPGNALSMYYNYRMLDNMGK
jgi:hypothetical protein